MPDPEGNQKGEENATPLHAYKQGREEDIVEGEFDAGGPAPLGEEPTVPDPTTPADPGDAVGSLSKDNPDQPAAGPGEGGGTQTPLEGPEEGGPGAGQQGNPEGQPPSR